MSGLVPQISPAIRSAVLLFMGYIDLGKWVAAIEGGVHLGPELFLLLFFFNGTAILCQYLANTIELVTGKNLAQICSEEYCRSTCVLLGIVAELCMVASDLTKILGVAHGFSLLFELDLFSCIFFAAIVAVIVPFFFTLLGSYKLEVLYISISTFTLIFYVLGVFLSQLEASSIINDRYSGLNLEAARSIMALLGAHIMPHNFYIHSYIVQQHGRQLNVSVGAMIHNHLFVIVSNFSVIFLVNYAMMSSAASVFNNYGLLVPTLQDAFLVMDQIFRSPAAPFPFSLIFFFSSLISALTLNCGGQVVLHNFFLIDLPFWVHHIIAKSLAVIPALYCTQSAGSEGIYQLLLFCQIISAILLLPSVIPLFRVSSSRLIMGAFKISPLVELFAVIAFMGMLVSNVIFASELLFGNSGWIVELRGIMGSNVKLLYPFLLILTFASLGFMLYLLVTPLRSLSDGPDREICTWELQTKQTQQSEYRKENSSVKILDNEDQKSVAKSIPQNSLECQCDCSFMDAYLGEPDTSVDSEGVHKSDFVLNPTTACISQAIHPEESVVDEFFVGGSVDVSSLQINGPIESIEEIMRIDRDVLPEDYQTVGSCEPLEPSTTSASRVHVSKKSLVNGKNVRVGSGREATSGLGRGGRRQLAAILDEFWGLLFDYHGKLTEEAKGIRATILLDLEFELSPTSMRAETAGKASSQKSRPDAEMHPVVPTALRGYNSPMPESVISAESPYVMPMGTPYWSLTMQSQDQQPTIRCFETIPCDRVFGAQRNSDSLDPPLSPALTKSSFTNNGDQFMHGLGQNGFGLSCGSGLQDPVAAASYYEPSFDRSNCSWDYTEKYNTIYSKNLLSNNRSDHWGDPFGYKASQYPNLDSRTEVVPLAFEDISESKHYEDDISLPMHVILGYEAFWSKNQFTFWTKNHFTPLNVTLTWGGKSISSRSGALKKFLTYGESERLVLQSLIFCIRKLLRLEGSDWLFSQNGGCDEELIDHLAAVERLLHKDGPCEVNEAQRNEVGDLTIYLPNMPYCGNGCIWQASLVASFGVWCVHRILELLLVENRPELWGKYTYVLNRLQGILDPAFYKPREPRLPCKCLQLPETFRHTKESPGGAQFTSRSSILELMKDVEVSIARRKSHSGTRAAKIAFSKGKENLASVFARYRRHLSKSSA